MYMYIYIYSWQKHLYHIDIYIYRKRDTYTYMYICIYIYYINPKYNLYILYLQHLSQPIGCRIGDPVLQIPTAQMDLLQGIRWRMVMVHPKVMQKFMMVNLCSLTIHWMSWWKILNLNFLKSHYVALTSRRSQALWGTGLELEFSHHSLWQDQLGKMQQVERPWFQHHAGRTNLRAVWPQMVFQTHWVDWRTEVCVIYVCKKILQQVSTWNKFNFRQIDVFWPSECLNFFGYKRTHALTKLFNIHAFKKYIYILFTPEGDLGHGIGHFIWWGKCFIGINYPSCQQSSSWSQCDHSGCDPGIPIEDDSGKEFGLQRNPLFWTSLKWI